MRYNLSIERNEVKDINAENLNIYRVCTKVLNGNVSEIYNSVGITCAKDEKSARNKAINLFSNSYYKMNGEDIVVELVGKKGDKSIY